jgi:uncharacterized protein (TIGR02452 family)
MYTDYAIYSPDVPVIRADDGTLLAEPYLCSFITCPAVNAKVVFAVTDWSPERRFIGPFEEVFGGSTAG